MSDGWECTGECRWVDRPQYEGKLIHNWTRVLQQLWRKLTGVGLVHSRSYDYEWRDVLTVTEEGE